MAEKTKKKVLNLLNRALKDGGPLTIEPENPPCLFFLHQPALPGKRSRSDKSSSKDCNMSRS